MSTSLWNQDLQLGITDMNELELAYLLDHSVNITSDLVTVSVSIDSEGTCTLTPSKYEGIVEIRYTTDGTIPVSNSSLYSEPFTVSLNTTVKVIAYYRGTVLSSVASAIFAIVGSQITLDGIECTIVYVKGDIGYACDNHGYGYYIDGTEDTGSDSTSNTFEWGPTNVPYRTNQEIGAGLANSNEALGMSESFDPDDHSYRTIWENLRERRQDTSSDKWFVPSAQELQLVYENRKSVPNLSTSSGYWSSSSNESYLSGIYVPMDTGSIRGAFRNTNYRCRLFRAI